jgi:hypothetical protein
MKAALLAALAGCYSPEVKDCSVMCESPYDCGGGQVCGSDGMCASSKLAGHCADLGLTALSLSIVIDGSGRVAVDELGACDSDTAPHHTCTFTVMARTTRTLSALANNEEHPFQSWAQACTGTSPSCSVVPVISPTLVEAKFQ